MVMNKSLLKNIHSHVKKLKEQAAPAPADPNTAPAPSAVPAETPPAAAPPAAAPAPATPAPDPNTAAAAPIPAAPTPDAAAGAAPTATTDAAPPPAEGEAAATEDTEGGGENEVPEGQPPVNKEDPITAVFDYGLEIAKQTIDPETILKAIKSSIQSNFGGNYEAAWAVVQRLKDTENTILIDVANRLSLFISGTIQENKDKGMKPMKVSKTELRDLVREAVKAKTAPTKKEVKLTKEQFEKVVRNVVVRKLNEGALFDTYRSQIDQEQSQIEQQLTSADIRRMAIDLFEKICDKTGVDSDSLTPEAMQFVKAELDRMVTSAQEIANKLIQVAAVVKTASSGAPKSEEGQG